MRMRSLVGGLVCIGVVFCVKGLFADGESEQMIVHEWGTFTALQNETGEQLLGINVDTEPVPNFVHNLGRFVLNDAVLSSHHWIHRQKSVPRNHPQVSLRLETPVIYFYPPKKMPLPAAIDVEVKFRGGWLTEFYPKASIEFPVVKNGEFEFTALTSKTIGQIDWKNLQVGTSQPGPKTNEHVWLAPRNVAAASVTSAEGEHEKYLFYRGVARQRAPLTAVTSNQGESLELTGSFQSILPKSKRINIQNLWLMETRPDGQCAYRRLEPVTVINDGNPAHAITAKRRFSIGEYSSRNRVQLETEMSDALIREGLYADETKALLSTWQQAYFVSPGLRVFYIVPREWTDYYLPLTISGEPQITRVMIGRLELISDRQRELLTNLAKTQVSDGNWMATIPEDSPALKQLLLGESDLSQYGISIPQDFQMYLDLGRFRNALIAAEEKRSRSPNLARFIQENQLEPFRLAQKGGK